MTCGAVWDYGGFEPDLPWDGTPCILPLDHEGWHRGPDDLTVTSGFVTWLVGR